MGSRITGELMGLERGERRELECHLPAFTAAVWRAEDGPEGGALVPEGILSEGSRSPVSHWVGLAQGTDPGYPRRSPSGGGGGKSWSVVWGGGD